MQQYLGSNFYAKYHDTYHSDVILKDVFGQGIRKHALRNASKLTYEEIHQVNLKVMRDFFELYWNDYQDDEKQAFQMIFHFYIDPDSAATKQVGDSVCTADGLISLKRLYAHEGITAEFLHGYELYRKKPIIFFPKERNGINMSRAAIFGDRIDYTLYDIKKYYEAKTFEEQQRCKLSKAYSLPITHRCLEAMGSFENMIDMLGVKGIFTTSNYDVYDIEKNNGSVIQEYLHQYSWAWSDAYYESLKEKIRTFSQTSM